MVETYKTIAGKDMGVLIGRAGAFSPKGILIYSPMPSDKSIPDFEHPEKFLNLRIGKFANVAYMAARKVDVNNQTVWMNKDCFDLPSRGINPENQVYRGRGDVKLEFRREEEVEGVDELILKILQRNKGLILL